MPRSPVGHTPIHIRSLVAKNTKKSCVARKVQARSLACGPPPPGTGASLPPRHVLPLGSIVCPRATFPTFSPRERGESDTAGAGRGSVGHHQDHGHGARVSPHPRGRLEVGLSWPLVLYSQLPHTMLHLRNSRNQSFYIYQQQRRSSSIRALFCAPVLPKERPDSCFSAAAATRMCANGDCDPCKVLVLLYCSTMIEKVMEDGKGRFSKCMIGSIGTASIRRKGLLDGQSVHNWMDGRPADPRRRRVRGRGSEG
jgi:hypothetical protein